MGSCSQGDREKEVVQIAAHVRTFDRFYLLLNEAVSSIIIS